MTHSKHGKPNGKPPTSAIPKHPDLKADELLASEVAALVGTERQSVLKRHERHPERLPGRLLPYVPGVSGSGRGVWAFKRSGVDLWKEERRAAKERRRRIASLRAQGFRINGKK